MRSLFAISAFFAISASSALSDCTPVTSNLDNFGLAVLGTKGAHLPSNLKRSNHCSVSPKFGYSDCELTDTKGVSYLLDGNIIVRKTVKPRPNIRLPFGLSSHDGFLTVVRKLSTASKLANMVIVYRDHEYTISTGLCQINKLQELFEVYVVFDGHGNLKMVGTRAESG